MSTSLRAQTCPNGQVNYSQYATTSSGGWAFPELGSLAPDNAGITVIGPAGPTYQGIFTYADTFSGGTSINITGKYIDSRVDGILLAFSTDGTTWTTNSALIGGFGSPSAANYTTVSYTIPTSLTGAYKYIRVQGNSSTTNLSIDAIQTSEPECVAFNASTFFDNGDGGGTKNNCTKDGTESIGSPSGLFMNVLQGSTVVKSFPVTNGQAAISGLADGTYTMVITNSPTANVSVLTPEYSSSSPTKTVVISGGVLSSPALPILFCLQILDTDSDGVPDWTDLDDDNDGILDRVEGCAPSVPPTNSLPRTEFAVPTGWSIVSSSPDISEVSYHVYGGWNIGGCTGNAPAAPNGHTRFVSFSSNTSEAFKTTVSGLVPGQQYTFTYYVAKFSLGIGLAQHTLSMGGTVINRFTPTVGCGWETQVVLFTPTQSTEDFTFRATNNSVLRFATVSVSADAITKLVCDTDNDGIANNLDLDSDGDGCSDAIEGGAAFTVANLVTSTIAGGNSGTGYTGTSTSPVTQNLGTTVGSTATTLGVPTVAGTGQTIGTSQNGGALDAACVICSKPVLTVQTVICSGTGSGYTISFTSNGTVTSSNGNVSGNTVTVTSGNATLTATASCGEVSSLVVAPSCPVPATCTLVPVLSVGNAVCTGTGFYSVSFSASNGTVSSNVGTVSGNTVVNIPVGTNAVLSITPSSTACNGQAIIVTSPVSCATPSCTDGNVGISFSTLCNSNGSYNINYTTATAGTTVTSSTNSFANLTGSVTLTVTKPGCSPQSVVVTAPVCAVCAKPVLTIENIACTGTGSGYTITFSSNATVTSSNGSISGNTITVASGNATLTSTTACGEATSLTVTAPICPVPAACTLVPNLSVGNALCTGTGFYSVSFTATNGSVTSSVGTVSGNTVTNIPVGVNAVLTLTPTSAACNGQSITVPSPTSCATPSCTDGSVGISISTSCNSDATYNINYTTSLSGTTVTSSANSFVNLTGAVTLTVTKPGCTAQTVVVSAPACVANKVKLMAKVFLQGAGSLPTSPYTANADGMMRTDITGILPTTEPYTALGFGTVESNTGSPTFTGTGTNAIVDWVLVELRSSASSSTVLVRKAALLQKDGDIVDMDGVSPLSFDLSPSSYYVAVRHRNHLGAMTLNTVPLSSTPLLIDFTQTSTATYGTNAQVTISGKNYLWAGNANVNKNVIAQGGNSDRSTVTSAVTSFASNTLGVNTYILPGYYTTDVNMDGKSVAKGIGADNTVILNIILGHPANSLGANVFIIQEQLP